VEFPDVKMPSGDNRHTPKLNSRIRNEEGSDELFSEISDSQETAKPPKTSSLGLLMDSSTWSNSGTETPVVVFCTVISLL